MVVEDGDLVSIDGTNGEVVLGEVPVVAPEPSPELFGDGTLVIEPAVAQTMMACPDDVTAQEQAYLETLMTVTGWSATEDELQLLDADDTVVARFG